MRIITKLSITALLSIIVMAGLAAYVYKLTKEIEHHQQQIQYMQQFSFTASQLSLLTEEFILSPDSLSVTKWNILAEQLKHYEQNLEDMQNYQLAHNTLLAISSAFDLLQEIYLKPELYPDVINRQHIQQRTESRLRSDMYLLITLGNRVHQQRQAAITELQEQQRRNIFFVILPAILIITLLIAGVQIKLLQTLKKFIISTKKITSGKLDERIELSGEDELTTLAREFNHLTDSLQQQIESERELRKNLEISSKELKQSNQELEQFAFVASHDLQEPLRMITSFLTQLERRYNKVLDEKGRKYIFFATDGARRMKQIILDLLEYSRLSKQSLEAEEVNLNEIMEEILLLNQKWIKETDAVITMDDLPVINAPKSPILQLFNNLLTNALKYKQEDKRPEIHISYHKENGVMEFRVSDNGVGINKKYYEKIFQVFQRLHSKEEYPGTGMGLAICKKITEKLDGKLHVASVPGKGSTFIVQLPE